MSKTDIWMPLYVADYLADTTRLTTEQHGAYLLLIMDYWRNGPLPDDDAALSNITRLPTATWKKHRPAIARMFSIEGGEWRHKRVDDEYAKAIAFREKQKANGAKGGRPRKIQTQTQEKPMGFVSDNPSESPSPSPSHKPKEAQAATTDTDPAAADPIQSRSLELVLLLRKRGAAIAAGNPHARRWAQAGVTDAQALAALETAEQRRADAGSVQPVNAGLLDSILADALKPQRAPPRRNVHDERAATIAALTGRSQDHEHESGNIIDITPAAAAG